MNEEYKNYDDLARLEYGRLFWKSSRMRARLLAHWQDPRHPYRESFHENRAMIVAVLESSEQDDPTLDRSLCEKGTSLRAVVRMIPPVFGTFW